MLTPLQYRVLMAVHKQITIVGVTPSQQELATMCGMRSRSQAHRLVCELTQRGYLRRKRGKARAIEVVRMPPNMADVCPACGRKK